MRKGTNFKALRDLHKQTTRKVLLQNHYRFPILRYYYVFQNQLHLYYSVYPKYISADAMSIPVYPGTVVVVVRAAALIFHPFDLTA